MVSITFLNAVNTKLKTPFFITEMKQLLQNPIQKEPTNFVFLYFLPLLPLFYPHRVTQKKTKK